MKSYLLKKIDSSYPEVSFEESKCYVFSPRLKNIPIKKVSVYDPELIENILTNKFNRSFRRILNYSIKNFSDDETDNSSEGAVIILDEIARLKSIVAHKYQQFLSEEKEANFYKQLNILEVEVQRELMELNMHNMVTRMNYYNQEENKGFSR